MFFDDRLATVLRQRADSDVGKRTQFRQLLDILGAERRSGMRIARDPSLLAAAWLKMDALGRSIPADRRAQIIREAGWRFRNPQLAAHLAEFEPDVAAAALTRAQLSAEDWVALIPRLPVRARGFLRLRRDLPVDVEQLLDRLGVSDRGLPAPPSFMPDSPLELVDEVADEAVPQSEEEEPEAEAPPQKDAETDADPNREGRSEISALVERIAQFRRNREGAAAQQSTPATAMPRLPLGEDQQRKGRMATGFGFAADAAGRIEWTDAEFAPMVIGTRLAPNRLAPADQDAPIARAVRRRQPISAATRAATGWRSPDPIATRRTPDSSKSANASLASVRVASCSPIQPMHSPPRATNNRL